MRYRIYFEALQPIEVVAFDIRVVGARKIACLSHASHAEEYRSSTVDIKFPCEIQRIAADDHETDIYRK